MSESEETRMVLVSLLKCLRCFYKWYPKPGRGLPKVCPNCKSHKWNVAPTPNKKAA